MKKFSFPLEKVLRYKNSILQEEKNKLSILRAELNRIEKEFEENSRQLLHSDKQLKEIALKGANIMELRSISFQIDNTRQLLEGLEKSRLKQENLIEDQLTVVLEINRSVSGIERLKEKHIESYREAQFKENELVISELVSTKYTQTGHTQ